MDIARILGGIVAAGRMGYGGAVLARPELAGIGWIGLRNARKPGTKLMIRSQGARDLALGAGALASLLRGRTDEARMWFAGQTVSDGTDFAVTWAERRKLPRRGVTIGLASAGACTAVAAIAAAVPRRSGKEG